MSQSDLSKSSCDLRSIKEAVCVHTDKVTDSCLAKDCIEDLRVYLTLASQQVLDNATGAKARCVELIHVSIRVEPVAYTAGYYSAELTYYYRVTGEASNGSGRPVTITGLAVFTKKVVLFGGESSARTFYSRECACQNRNEIENAGNPTVAVDVVDPIVLGTSVADSCGCNSGEMPILSDAILSCFDEELVLQGENKRLLVTIGQFSITRMQRSTQLLMPAFDYCIPTKDCAATDISATGSPCEVFGQIEFPIDSFFPTKNDACIPPERSCTCCKSAE